MAAGRQVKRGAAARLMAQPHSAYRKFLDLKAGRKYKPSGFNGEAAGPEGEKAPLSSSSGSTSDDDITDALV